MTAASRAMDYRALLAQQDWPTLRTKLKLYAYVATGRRSMERAEDLAHDAIARMWTDAGVRWNPAVEPNVFRFLTGLLRGDLSNERRVKRTTHEVLTGDEALDAQGDGGRGSGEALYLAHESVALAFVELHARAAGEPAAAAVTRLFERGIDGAAEQARESGLPIDEVRRARRRVFDHAAAIERKARAKGEG